MLMMIYFGFILLNCIFAFYKKNDKFLLISTSIFIIIFMLGNSSAPDYLSYFNDYIQMQTSGISSFNDIGFVFLEKFFINLNLNFSCFRLFIIVLSFFLVYNGLKRYEVNFHYILSVYMIYQCFMDTMQIRNFLATSIFIYASQYLFISNKKNRIKYLLLIFIASSIHSSLIFYSIFILIDYFISNRKGINILLLLSFLVSLIIFVFPTVVNQLHYIFIFVGKEQVFLRYFSNVGESLGFLLPLLSFIILSAFMYYFKVIKFSKNSSDLNGSFYFINKISMIFFPLVIIDPTWYRINRGLNLINYSNLWLIYEKQTEIKKRLISFASAYFIAFLWFFIECVIWIGLDIIIPMLQINGFWL